MRLYETGFLISPNLPEEETDKIIQQMADIVSQRKGNLTKKEVWGKKRLAYPIKKFEEAFYVFFHYEGKGDIPLELGRRFRQMDSILRFLTVKKDVRENVRRLRKTEAETAAKEETAEAATGQEGASSSAGDQEEK